MKLTKQLFGFALTAIAAGAFVACTNELTDPSLNKGKDGVLKLVKTPEVYAWSGNQTLNSSNLSDVYTVPSVGSTSNTVNTRADEEDVITFEKNIEYGKIDCKATIDYIQLKLPENGDNLGEDMITDFLYYAEEDCELIFIPIYTQSNTTHNIKFFYYSKEDPTKKIYAKETLNIYKVNNQEGHQPDVDQHYGNSTTVWFDSSGEMHYNGDECSNYQAQPGHGEWLGNNYDIYDHHKAIKIAVKAGYKFGIEWNGHDDAGSYNWSSVCGDNKFDNKKYGEGSSNIHATTFYKDGCTYLGIEDWIDFDYQDLVFVCTDIIKTVNSKNTEWGKDDDGTETPTPPTPENKCPNIKEGVEGSGCDHYHDGPYCGDPECDAPDCHKCEYCDHPESDCSEDGGCKHKNCECPNCKVEKDDEVCNVPGCGHPKHDDKNCEQCEEGTTCHPSNSTGGNTGTTKPGEVYKHDNEVEVNFEAVDSHKNLGIEDLATKLSIHVRHAIDVDIKIPVPSKYVIDSDDLYILNEHYGKFGDDPSYDYHGSKEEIQLDGVNQTLRYLVNGQYEVFLHVDFMAGNANLGDKFKEGYIHVWTEGITQEVIDWCMEHNGDGINFEVWTYYSAETANTKADREKLKEYFNASTIEFIIHDGMQSKPDYYINAFGYDYEDGTWGQKNKDVINPDDCFVKPIQSEPYNPSRTYNEGEKWDEHLNGTPYNQIYVKNGATPDHAHGGLN